MGETPIHACHSCGTTRRLRSQQKAPGQGLGCSGLRRQPSGSMARPAYRRPSRDKAGPGVYARAPTGSIAPTGKQETRMKRVSWIWYRGGDSNPYSLWPLPPQGSVSTNSTTSAKPLPYCPGTSGTSSASIGADCPSRTGTSSSTTFFGTSRTAGSGRPIWPSCSAFWLAKYARPRLVTKKTAASIPVTRLRKVAEPWLPNTVPDAPAPKEAPASAPFPCCSNTRPTRPSAISR